MRAFIIFLLIAQVLKAHVVSMSNGELKIEGASASFEFQVPLYETRDIRDPANTLLNRIHFSSGGVEARILTRSCVEDRSLLICKASYLFNRDVEMLHVESELQKVLVTNHVFVVHATMGGHSDQAFLDYSFPIADLRFRPPSFWESFTRDVGNGIWRASSAIATILFLVSIVLAASSVRQLGLLALMFACGEVVAAMFGGALSLSSQFLETASALTVAYLAIEVLLLPNAGQRWLVVGILGAFHGLYFAMFQVERQSGFLVGVVLGELIVLVLIRLGVMALLRMFPGVDRPWWTRVCAGVLAMTGAGWFILRMMS